MSSNNPSLSSSKSKKKIIINIDRPPLHNKNRQHSPKNTKYLSINDQSCKKNSQTQDLTKLLGISERCQINFEEYSQIWLQQQRQAQLVFAELQQYLQQTFLQIFETIEAKKDELKQIIQTKRLNLFEKRENQHRILSQNINRIIDQDMYFHECKQIPQSGKMGQFAQSLNQFYENIDRTQNRDYQNQFKNLVQEIKNKIINQNIKYTENVSNNNASISFNNGHLFSSEEKDQFCDIVSAIAKNQLQRQSKLSNYPKRIIQNYRVQLIQ